MLSYLWGIQDGAVVFGLPLAPLSTNCFGLGQRLSYVIAPRCLSFSFSFSLQQTTGLTSYRHICWHQFHLSWDAQSARYQARKRRRRRGRRGGLQVKLWTHRNSPSLGSGYPTELGIADPPTPRECRRWLRTLDLAMAPFFWVAAGVASKKISDQFLVWFCLLKTCARSAWHFVTPGRSVTKLLFSMRSSPHRIWTCFS